jgi:hypothetical protein
MKEFAAKVALITGGNAGIGRATGAIRPSSSHQSLRNLPALLHQHARGGFAPAHALLPAGVLRGRVFRGRSSGCDIIPLGLDPATGIFVFYATSDPFGTNPYGDQLFALRPDGTLRQLTHARHGLLRLSPAPAWRHRSCVFDTPLRKGSHDSHTGHLGIGSCHFTP